MQLSRCQARIAVLFKELRVKLDRLLADKIKQPELDLWEDGKPVVDAIVQLLATEKIEARDNKR
jgi:ATP-dependent RNA helicase DHX57